MQDSEAKGESIWRIPSEAGGRASRVSMEPTADEPVAELFTPTPPGGGCNSMDLSSSPAVTPTVSLNIPLSQRSLGGRPYGHEEIRGLKASNARERLPNDQASTDTRHGDLLVQLSELLQAAQKVLASQHEQAIRLVNRRIAEAARHTPEHRDIRLRSLLLESQQMHTRSSQPSKFVDLADNEGNDEIWTSAPSVLSDCASQVRGADTRRPLPGSIDGADYEDIVPVPPPYAPPVTFSPKTSKTSKKSRRSSRLSDGVWTSVFSSSSLPRSRRRTSARVVTMPSAEVHGPLPGVRESLSLPTSQGSSIQALHSDSAASAARKVHSAQTELSAASACVDYKLHDAWTDRVAPTRAMREKRFFKSSRSMRATYDRLTEAYQSEAEEPLSWMISPHSSARVLWDVLGMVLVTYDLISMPLQLFDPPWTGLAAAMAWVTRLFWTLDLVASFVSGYIKPNGTIEMEPRKVAVNYFSSWFLLDVIIITSDWMELAATDNHTAWSIVLVGRASRTVRLIRLVRFLRLMRLRGVLRVLCERIQSETLSLLANIVQILIMLTALAHLIACAWYGIGDSEAPATWVKAHELEDKTLWYRYTIALHWSLQQFGGGTDEVVPYNVGERVFAIAVFVLGFASSAFFVSSMTSSMTQLYIITSQNTRKLSALKRWMRDVNVSPLLAMRVLRNTQHAILEEQRFMPEAKVELLHLVSEPLRVELHFEMYSPVLDLHPFFQMYRAECPQVVRRICHDAVGWLTVSRGDVVFHAGESPTVRNMYFTGNDSMQYAPISGGFLKVLPHQWVAEAVLWIADWSHVGTLMALCNTSLTALNAEKFQDIASIFSHDLFDPKVYATQFVMAFNRQGHNTMDTPLPEEEMDHIMQVLAAVVAPEVATD